MLKKVVLVMLTALLVFVVPVSAQEEVLELGEVVVTASRYQESIMETPVSIEVIDQEEIEESSARNLADLLKSAGSVHIKDNGGLTGLKSVLIRGARQNQLLYLIDGQPLNSPQDGSVRLSDIPTSIVKKIEILKSAASSIYGANAMGGVINIITKSTEYSSDYNFKIGLGSYNTQSYNLAKGYNFDKASLWISYNKLKSDDHRDDPDQDSSFDRNNLFLKYNYNINNSLDLKMMFKYNNIQTKYPGSSSTDDYGSRDEQGRNINISLEQNLDHKERELVIYNNDQNVFNKTRYASSAWGPAGYSITDLSILKRGLNFKETNYKFNSHVLNYGFEITKNQVENNQLSADNTEKNINRALYIQDKYQLNNNIVIIGARYDMHQEYGNNFSPRASYLYRISENLNFNMNYGESFRAPTFLDLYGMGGNENLEAEKGKNYDLGFKYSDSICQREITFFKRKFEDLLKYNSTSFIMENISEAEITGVELSTNRKINKKWNVDFNYTYLEAREDGIDKQMLNMPYNEFSLKIKFANNSYKAALNNNYVGKTRDYGDVKVESYFISDLKLSKSIFENSKISFKINNIFDKDYEVVAGYPMPGRNYMVNLSTKF